MMSSGSDPRSAPGPYRAKRLLDLIVLALVAVPAGALGIVAALAVRLTSAGPIFFRQARIGLGAEPFECLKFRTMVHGDNPLVPDASRITTVGKWLRRYSLDELPQLINVARGEMSIVGPRPMLPFQADRCDERQRGRFAVRPGLTGIAQISGRNALSWPERIDHDLDYVQRQSVLTDLRTILNTPRALLSGEGVTGHDVDDPFVTALAEADDA